MAAVLGAARVGVGAPGARSRSPASPSSLVLVGFSAPSVREEFRDDFDRATSGRSSLVGNGVRIARDNAVAGVGLGGFRREYAERTGSARRGAEAGGVALDARDGRGRGRCSREPALRLAAR